MIKISRCFKKQMTPLSVGIRRLPVGVFLGLIRLYQVCAGVFKAPCCRFTPTCSAYAKEAFLLHGARKGAMLTLKRLLKCHPWGAYGYDPVPPKGDMCMCRKKIRKTNDQKNR